MSNNTKSDFLATKYEYEKCAPSKEFTDGSCFNIKSLQKIATEYNKHIGKKNNDEIKISNSKRNLVSDLTNKITECGEDQLCWLEVDWIKKIKDYDIHHNTFRPKGPQGRFQWLSTTNINEIAAQYEHKYSDFKFLGAVPLDFEDLSYLKIGNLNFDEFIKSGKNKFGLVINLDYHWEDGSHWVALYCDLPNNKIYYFDSYGSKPKQKIADFVKRVALWCNKRNILKTNSEDIDDTESKFMTKRKNKYEEILDIKYNKVRHQFKNSECGVYSVNFILRLLKGESFNFICNNITLDEEVNECRDTYFRFK